MLCRGAVRRPRVMAHGMQPLDVSRRGMAQCAMCGRSTWHGVARRGEAWHGVVRCAACGGVARGVWWHGTVRGVRQGMAWRVVTRHVMSCRGAVCGGAVYVVAQCVVWRGVECGGVVQCMACGRPMWGGMVWGDGRFSAGRRVVSRRGTACSHAWMA